MADGRYLTDDAFRQWARDEVTTDDTLVGEAILAAEQEIDKLLVRRVEVAGAASNRSYTTGRCVDRLIIDDCTTVVSVTENGTALTEGTHYQLEPLNGIDSAGASVPYDVIRRLDQYWYHDGPKAVVVVNATWGWAAIPPLVLEACKSLTKDILLNRDVRNGIVAVTEQSGISARDNDVVKRMTRAFPSKRNVLAA